jgi:hypothetical protein
VYWPRRDCTALSLLYGLAQFFWGVWIFVGFLFILIYASCRKTAPALYNTTAVVSSLLLFGSQVYHILILCLMLSPAANTLRILAAESLGEGNRVASKAEIQQLGSVQWTPDLLDDDADNSCAICLANYEQGDELRMLPCRDAVGEPSARGHYFHGECIDTWLVRQAACPICKQDIDPKRRPRKEDIEKMHLDAEGRSGTGGYHRSADQSQQEELGDIDVDSAGRRRGDRDDSPLETRDLRLIEAGRRGGGNIWTERHASDPFPAARSVHEIINLSSAVATPSTAETYTASSTSPMDSDHAQGERPITSNAEPDVESGLHYAPAMLDASEHHLDSKS